MNETKKQKAERRLRAYQEMAKNENEVSEMELLKISKYREYLKGYEDGQKVLAYSIANKILEMFGDV